jgi:predicted Rossmann fold flavoprotein
LVEEQEGRMFPVANTARVIYDALVSYCVENNVQILSNCGVTKITHNPKTGLFTVAGKNNFSLSAVSCVVATGGTSRPETGSTGDGYGWLRSLGHTVSENNFALVPIAVEDSWVKKLGGVSLPEVKITIFSDSKKHSVKRGKILFTHFGLSGPAILNASSEIGELLSHSHVTLQLDLLPTIEAGDLKRQFIDAVMSEPNKKVKNVLSRFVKNCTGGATFAPGSD